MQGKSGIFIGKTLDDAVKKGLETLGLSRAAVMITVLEEGSGGFLGIGARPYKVRMAPRPRRELIEEGGGRREREGRGREPRGDREHDRRPRRSGARGESRSGERSRPAGTRDSAAPGRRASAPGRTERAPGRREESPVRSEVPPRRRDESGVRGGDSARRRDEPEVRSDSPGRGDEAVARSEDVGSRRDDDRSGRRRRRGRGRSEAGEGARPRDPGNDVLAGPGSEPPPRSRAPGRPDSVPAPNPGSHSETPEMTPDQLQAVASEHTQGMLRAMGFEASVSAVAEGTSVEVKAEVPRDGELLVGPKGEVRQALQHLLNRMVNRDQASRYHLQLEVNDFWHQREEELQSLARSLADEAVAEGREKITEYLNAQERRIIHVTLREDGRVSTQAIGDGLIKKISIAPAGASEDEEAEEPEESETAKSGD